MDLATDQWTWRNGIRRGLVRTITLDAGESIAVAVGAGFRPTVRVAPADGASGTVKYIVAEDSAITDLTADDFTDSGQGAMTATDIVTEEKGDITHLALIAAAGQVVFTIHLVEK